MDMAEEIINKIALSGIQTLDLAKYYPETSNVVELDLKGYLFMEMILKEKDFRKQLSEKDWSEYQGKIACIICTVDALIPHWAYMLLASYLHTNAQEVFIGTPEQWIEKTILSNIENQLEVNDLEDVRVVIKGCGDKNIPASAYYKITELLLPVAKSIMYGEPCSTVPVFKRK
jgi:hypothetical protein